MVDSLAESFVADLGCDATTAGRLAGLARACLTHLAPGADDTDEDRIHRLRDPRVFGQFTVSVLQERELPEAVCIQLAEHAFDLLPLPRGEGDIILVEGRAPPGLLTIARYLAGSSRLTVLHVMHLVFAVYLDRTIVQDAEPTVRASALAAVLDVSEAGAPLRSFYAALHLAAVPESEAYREFRRILRWSRDAAIPTTLARAVTADDGGVDALLRIARSESLVPDDRTDPTLPEVVASIPRLPPRLAAAGRRWLSRDA